MQPMVPYLINSYVTRVCPLSLKQHSLLLYYAFVLSPYVCVYPLSISLFLFSLLLKDNAELFAMMEKTRMYIFRNLDPEVFVKRNISLYLLL